ASRAGATLPPHWALPEFSSTPLQPMPPAPSPAAQGIRSAGPQEGAVPGDERGAAAAGDTAAYDARPRPAEQGALLSPYAPVPTQPPAPVFASRPSTVLRTAPNEVVVPLTPRAAPAVDSRPVVQPDY